VNRFPRPTPTLGEQRAIMLKHYDLVVQRFRRAKGERNSCASSLAAMRKAKPGARIFRGRSRTSARTEEFYAAVEGCFSEGVRRVQGSGFRVQGSGRKLFVRVAYLVQSTQ